METGKVMTILSGFCHGVVACLPRPGKLILIGNELNDHDMAISWPQLGRQLGVDFLTCLKFSHVTSDFEKFQVRELWPVMDQDKDLDFKGFGFLGPFGSGLYIGCRSQDFGSYFGAQGYNDKSDAPSLLLN